MESYDNRKLNSVGSSRIRGRWIAKYWDECTEYEIGDKADVMIYQKAYWRDHMRDFKGLKIFDICDPDWLDGSPVKEVSSYMDAFVVPTETLKAALEDFIDVPVFVIPDRFDLEDYPKVYKKEHSGRARSCVWYGYSGNAHVLDKSIQYLKKEGLSLTCIADKVVGQADENITYNYDTIQSDIIEHDILLLPPADSSNARFKFKSNNKTIEGRLLGMPVAKSYEDLKRFLDPLERQKEADKYYDKARKEYDVRLSVKEWKKSIKELN